MPRTPRRSRAGRSQAATPQRTPRQQAVPATTAATPSSGRGSDGLFQNGRWYCDCTPRRAAVLRETRKPGVNQGRWFYTCPQERRRQCTFFLWEDFAGVSAGGGDSGRPAAGPSSHSGPSGPSGASARPRSTYRTSIGRRTTPPPPIPPLLLPTGQRALPLPTPPTTISHQRIFTTRVRGEGASMDYDNEDNEDDEDADDKLPPTPTPIRRHQPIRTGTANAAAAGPSNAASSAASNTIEKYFGVVKSACNQKHTSKNIEEPSPEQPLELPQEQPNAGRSPASPSDYSSGFDSDTERGILAIARDVEAEIRRRHRQSSGTDTSTDEGRGNARHRRGRQADDGGAAPMDIDSGVVRGEIVVPVPLADEAPLGNGEGAAATTIVAPKTPGGGSMRHSRRLLVASDEYAAKEAAAAATAGALFTAAASDTGSNIDSASTSFASIFSSDGDKQQQQQQQQQQRQRRQRRPRTPQTPPAEPSSSFSFSSPQPFPSSMTATSVMTTPPSSFRSDAVFGPSPAGASFSGQKRRRDKEARPWYEAAGTPDGNDSDGDGDGRDSITPTPFKRRRMPRSGGDQDGEDRADGGAAPPVGKDIGKGKHKEVLDAKDHNVTLAVLQLLADQPVDGRVRRQVQALLNGAFDEQQQGE